MCLAIPMQIIQIDGHTALCDAHGIRREVNLFMLQDSDITEGDFVMVHVGYAIQKVDKEAAQASWGLFGQMRETEQSGDA